MVFLWDTWFWTSTCLLVANQLWQNLIILRWHNQCQWNQKRPKLFGTWHWNKLLKVQYLMMLMCSSGQKIQSSSVITVYGNITSENDHKRVWLLCVSKISGLPLKVFKIWVLWKQEQSQKWSVKKYYSLRENHLAWGRKSNQYMWSSFV